MCCLHTKRGHDEQQYGAELGESLMRCTNPIDNTSLAVTLNISASSKRLAFTKLVAAVRQSNEAASRVCTRNKSWTTVNSKWSKRGSIDYRCQVKESSENDRKLIEVSKNTNDSQCSREHDETNRLTIVEIVRKYNEKFRRE